MTELRCRQCERTVSMARFNVQLNLCRECVTANQQLYFYWRHVIGTPVSQRAGQRRWWLAA